MRSADQSQRGASAVEFAVLAPLFIALLFAIVEFGMIIYTKAMMTHASREGARFGVVYAIPRKTTGEIQTIVRQYLDQVGLTAPATVQVTYPDGNSNSGSRLDVKVNYTYQFYVVPKNINNYLQGKMANINMTAETVMRLE
jgi:Flp pilus assembly protein TadG